MLKKTALCDVAERPTKSKWDRDGGRWMREEKMWLALQQLSPLFSITLLLCFPLFSCFFMRYWPKAPNNSSHNLKQKEEQKLLIQYLKFLKQSMCIMAAEKWNSKHFWFQPCSPSIPQGDGETSARSWNLSTSCHGGRMWVSNSACPHFKITPSVHPFLLLF